MHGCAIYAFGIQSNRTGQLEGGDTAVLLASRRDNIAL